MLSAARAWSLRWVVLGSPCLAADTLKNVEGINTVNM
jgi:hypothetical protein